MKHGNELTQTYINMEFVQKFTLPDFQAKNFTPSISPNFNSFSKKKHKKMSENKEFYTAGKNFTLPPALTPLANSTSDVGPMVQTVICTSNVKLEWGEGGSTLSKKINKKHLFYELLPVVSSRR